MLDLFEIHKDTILKVLCLQKCLSINWAIEETLEAEIPHQVFNVFFAEKVFIEVVSKVIHDSLEVGNLIFLELFII